ncbi:MAG: divergent polysaccharide deacetylase family protein [Spirochaetales bacterium]|nr:divergent polysaccharide deacetylase family protein [Spirochaetales bacterium]
MAHGKGSSNRSRTTRKRGRDRLILYLLLIVIAGLLGVIVALLPDTPPGEADDQPSRSVGDEMVQRRAEEAEPESEDEAPSIPEDGPPETVTERYPVGEAPATPAATAAESDREFWWLPDPDVYGEAPGTLYLILDDAGNNLEPFPAFLEFPGPLAVAVLPQLPYSVEAAALTAAAGKEIMLHLPMEAVGGANPGPGAVTVGMSDRDILRVIGENLGSVPGAIGVNNHMGSRATSDQRIMEIVLADLQRRELFFIDSRTTVDTVARPVAGYLRTPFAERHIFLDNERSRDAILAAIRGALELAHTQDQVVMIGHATVPELATILNEIYPVLTEHGYRFGLVSELAEVPEVAEVPDGEE